jgi:hypothetical protein
MSAKCFQRIQNPKHLRLRVENCVLTILELNQKLGAGKIKPEIIRQFERLRESLRFVTDDTVDERDISRIEEATNQLLAQIRISYAEEDMGDLFDGHRH